MVISQLGCTVFMKINWNWKKKNWNIFILYVHHIAVGWNPVIACIIITSMYRRLNGNQINMCPNYIVFTYGWPKLNFVFAVEIRAVVTVIRNLSNIIFAFDINQMHYCHRFNFFVSSIAWNNFGDVWIHAFL